uniref:Protein krueppel n=1 Tax=Anopheles farauti TaxID=69004 RepID=A0A182Q1I0_9DIPT
MSRSINLSALSVISYETVWSEDGRPLPRSEAYLSQEQVAFDQNATLVTVSDGGEDFGIEGDDDMQLIQITCRICGVVFSRVADSLLADLVQTEDLVRKYLPFVNLELPNLPRKICLNCSKVVNGFSKFSESVLRAQSDLEHRFAPQPARTNATPTIAPPVGARTKQENAAGKPMSIKQEPIANINIKEEKTEYARQKDFLPVEEPIEGPVIIKNQTFGAEPNRIYLFNNINQDLTNGASTSATLAAQQSREPSKNCEILEIVNLYPPIVDITSATVTEVQPYEITMPSVATATSTESSASLSTTAAYSAQLKVENTAELDAEQDDYYLPEKISFINTLEEHSYTKLPIQADDNKDEILHDMVMVGSQSQWFGSANVITAVKNKPSSPPRSIRRWACTNCDRRFVRHRRMMEHRTWECPGRRKPSASCQFCRRKFGSWSMARAHVCVCPKRALKHSRLKWRMISEKDKMKQKELWKLAGQRPYQEEVVVTKYPCSMCDRSYSNASNLRRHLSTHRPQEQWNHKCGVCFTVFDKLIDLKRHLQIAPCGNAGNTIAVQASDTHGVEVELPAELPVPLPNVPESRPLDDMAAVPSITPSTTVDRLLYVCSTCNKIFKSYSNLKMHEPIHTGVKTSICETCGKRFTGPSNLWQHRLTHSEVRQFNCNQCPKVFKRKGGLSQHVRAIHMNIKPYQCPTCGHEYALKADMTRCRHSRLHDSTTLAC